MREALPTDSTENIFLCFWRNVIANEKVQCSSAKPLTLGNSNRKCQSTQFHVALRQGTAYLAPIRYSYNAPSSTTYLPQVSAQDTNGSTDYLTMDSKQSKYFSRTLDVPCSNRRHWSCTSTNQLCQETRIELIISVKRKIKRSLGHVQHRSMNSSQMNQVKINHKCQNGKHVPVVMGL